MLNLIWRQHILNQKIQNMLLCAGSPLLYAWLGNLIISFSYVSSYRLCICLLIVGANSLITTTTLLYKSSLGSVWNQTYDIIHLVGTPWIGKVTNIKRAFTKVYNSLRIGLQSLKLVPYVKRCGNANITLVRLSETPSSQAL